MLSIQYFPKVNRNVESVSISCRYGREDEEVMGLKFCNEAIIALQQIWPTADAEPRFDLSTLQVIETFPILTTDFWSFSPFRHVQDALIERLGKNSVPFAIEIGSITPPSVQLLPAKRYTGAPIGTSYDIRVYTGN